MAESLYDNLFPQETQPRAATASATGGLYNDLFPAEQQQPRYQTTLSQSPDVWRQRLGLDLLEDREGLPRGTMSRLVRLESGGDPGARSPAGAQGLFQLMPATAAQYKVDPYNPAQAADAAAKEFGSLYRKYNASMPHAVAAWNWGQGNLDRQGLDKAPPETRAMIANMGADVPADMRAQGVQFVRPSTGLPVTRIATEQGIVPALAAPSPTIPGSFLLEQLRQLEPGAAATPPLLEEKWPAATPGTSLIKSSMIDPATGLIREGDILSDVSAGTTKQLAPEGTLGRAALGAAKEAAATGTQFLATTAGSEFGPVGAGLASYWAHQFNKELGLTPGEPTLLPRDLGDYVSLLPGLPVVRDVAKWGLRQMRGPRALIAAEEQTAAGTTAAQTKFQQEAFAKQEQALAQTEADQAKYAAQVAKKQAGFQDRMSQAHDQGVADAATERAAQGAYDQTIQTQRGAVQRAQDLPGRYLPEVPKRTIADVERDLRFLDTDDAAARVVVQRLGADDIFDAAAKLQEEARALGGTAARTTPLPGQPIPPASRQAAPKPVDQGPELQAFIRNQGGMRLEGEELARDIRPLLGSQGRQKGSTTGLLNNQSGKTVQEIAEAAGEAGYPGITDKDSLLAQLRESRAGRPVYSTQRTVEAPAEQAYLPPSMRPSESPELHRASGVVYERLGEIGPSAPATLQMAKIGAADVLAELGEGLSTLPPSGLRKVAMEILEMGDNGNVAQVATLLKQLTQASRTAKGTQKYLFNRLHEALFDTLEASAPLSPLSAEAVPMVRQVRQMYRQEAAVGDLQRLTRQSMQRVSIPGDPTKLEWKIDTAKLIKDFDTFVDSPRGEYFRRSFQPEEFTQLRSDIEGFAGTPQYPTSARPPAPTFLPGRIDVGKLRDPMAGMQPPPPRQVTFGDPDVLRPGDPQRAFTVRPYEVPPPVEPQLRVPSPGRLMKDIMYTAVPTFAGTGGYGTAAAVGATVAAGDLAMYGLAKLMISPQMRPLVLRMLQQSGGKITPEIYGLLGAAAAEAGRE